MKIALASFNSEEFIPLGKLTFDDNKKVYAEKWGYSTFHKVVPITRHLGFLKVE